jgi:hypothetical protein
VPPVQDSGVVITPPEVPTAVKAGGPILPPLAPPAPAWKQEIQPEVEAVSPGAANPELASPGTANPPVSEEKPNE